MDSEYSSSSDDELLLLYSSYRRQSRKRHRSMYMDEINMCRNFNSEYSSLCPDLRSLSADKHKAFYRMSKERYDYLLKKVEPLITHPPNHRYNILPDQRLSITLRILAHGDSQGYIAIRDRVAQKTVNGIFNETCRAIYKVLQPEFLPPPTLQQMQSTAQSFWELWQFPNCVGSIDGKHIAIKAPAKAGSRYFNYKGFHSIVLLAACDAQYCFTIVDVGAWGRMSDGGVFSNSDFGQQIEADTMELAAPKDLPGSTNGIALPHVFVADEAFPLRHTIMRPFPGRNKGVLPENQRIFNYRLSRARRTIENAFGILAARWGILRKPIEASPENAEAIVLATVALHNYLKKTDATEQAPSKYVPACFADYEDSDGILRPGDWRNIITGDNGMTKAKLKTSNNYASTVKTIRDEFMNYFLTEEGSVPWQWTVVNRGKE